jgi:hypothetical protein
VTADTSGAGANLAERVAGLRDEVLAAADGQAPGGEVFDAVVRVLSARARDAGSVPDVAAPDQRTAPDRPRPTRRRPASSDLDLALHDAIARRLAWRDSELHVLGDARDVCHRLLAAARRALSDPAEEMEVARAVAEAGSAAARILISLVLGRVARERAALLREERAQDRLTEALARQREELARLEKALAGANRT